MYLLSNNKVIISRERNDSDGLPCFVVKLVDADLKSNYGVRVTSRVNCNFQKLLEISTTQATLLL
jgi:hypothetical protein